MSELIAYVLGLLILGWVVSRLEGTDRGAELARKPAQDEKKVEPEKSWKEIAEELRSRVATTPAERVRLAEEIVEHYRLLKGIDYFLGRLFFDIDIVVRNWRNEPVRIVFENVNKSHASSSDDDEHDEDWAYGNSRGTRTVEFDYCGKRYALGIGFDDGWTHNAFVKIDGITVLRTSDDEVTDRIFRVEEFIDGDWVDAFPEMRRLLSTAIRETERQEEKRLRDEEEAEVQADIERRASRIAFGSDRKSDSAET